MAIREFAVSREVDLNLDAGESSQALVNGTEAALYDLVTSVNIACGGHAGNATTMVQAVDLAISKNVKIGAHPSYPDLAGFGRVTMNLKPDALIYSLCEQMETLLRICSRKGAALTHVKPHGALYNRAADDRSTAVAVIEAVARIDAKLTIVGLAGTAFAHWCGEAGMNFIGEGFPDRRYEPNGRLRSRDHEDAVISDPSEAAIQAADLIKNDFNGQIHTLCIHGEAANAFEIATAIRRKLLDDGIKISPACGHSPH